MRWQTETTEPNGWSSDANWNHLDIGNAIVSKRKNSDGAIYVNTSSFGLSIAGRSYKADKSRNSAPFDPSVRFHSWAALVKFCKTIVEIDEQATNDRVAFHEKG